jgi:hypothetical protein
MTIGEGSITMRNLIEFQRIHYRATFEQGKE